MLRNGFPRALCVAIAFAVVLAMTASGCAGGKGLSGRYSSEDGAYAIEFSGNGTCRWVWGDEFFDGTYEYDAKEGDWNIYIKGHGISWLGYDNAFDAVESGSALTLYGGTLNWTKGKVFVKG